MANINGTQSDDTLNGTFQADTINGLGGDDIIFAQQGGDDVINAGTGEDGILFGAVFTAADQVDGGDGTDGIVLTGDYSAGLTLAATTIANIEILIFDPGFNYRLIMNDANVAAGLFLVVDASLLGAANSLHFDASAETDGRYTLRGGDGNDVLVGSGGNDSITGRNGDDRVVVSGGVDDADGGGGFDILVVDYSATTGQVRATHSTFAGTMGGFTDDLGRRVSYDLFESLDITTGNQNDTIIAGFGDDRIILNGGDDTLNGQAGNDIADGGAGIDGVGAYWVDVTTAVSWNLQTNSYSGPGSFTNFEYFTILQTGSGNDNIVTTAVDRDETIRANGGDDIITVVNGSDSVDGGEGDDTLVVDFSGTTGSVTTANPGVPGAAGSPNGTIQDQVSRTVLYGSIEQIHITTGNKNDNLATTDGDDRVFLRGGNDYVDVGAGDDFADGGVGTDGITWVMRPGVGGIVWNLQANSFSGPIGSFTNFEYFVKLWTSSGDDVIVTTALPRDEQISTSAGDDSITVVNGMDEVFAGAGFDTLVIDYSGAATSVQVWGFNSGTVDGYSGRFAAGGAREVRFDSIERFVITGGAFNDSISMLEADDIFHGGGGNDAVGGGSGDDLLEGGAGQDNLLGEQGADTLDGGTGADTMTGGFGWDTYIVDDSGDQAVEVSEGQGTDIVLSSASYVIAYYVENLTLTGTADISGKGNFLANTITGNVGANLINGDSGADTMIGGSGDDIYVLDNVSDSIVEEAGGGIDTVRTSIAWTLVAELENLQLTGTASFGGTGNAADNVLTGNSGANLLDGAAGADTMAGGLGDDQYRVDNALDQVTEALGEGTDIVESLVSFTLGSNVEKLILVGAGVLNGTGGETANNIIGNASANVLKGEGGDDKLEGGNGNDTLDGGDGADFLVGGAGLDTLKGGVGDDLYIIGVGDVIVEAAGAGVENISADFSYTLGANLEDLGLFGTAAINGTGNGLVNHINGNAANNVLDGGIGADVMAGGPGSDTYYVDNVLDEVWDEDGLGIDTVISSVNYSLGPDFTFGKHLERLVLTGNAVRGTGNNHGSTIIGNDRDNILVGGAGGDTLNGGLGNDTYVINGVYDRVIEAAGGGVDQVQSSVGFTLGSNVENLILTGTAAINGTGNGLDNTIAGNDGANVLSGAAGADTMNGGLGNDAYVVDNALDKVIETNAGGGTEKVTSSVSFTLGGNVENLGLVGSAAINATGNGLANTLVGNGGVNVLNGAAGADTMQGGLGSDTYVVDNVLDKAIETSATGGTDLVRSSVSFNLGGNVENLTLLGSAVIDGTGNNGANQLVGNNAANILEGINGNDMIDGAAGNDELHGGVGNDSLNGGTGADGFVFNTALNASTNLDHILDFVHAIDEIRLENAVFTTLAAGALSANAFRLGAAALDADDRILYDAATGALYYDKDGTGAVAAVQFATLDNMPATLNATDFLVI